MNFLANHDTQEVFDRTRTRTFEAGTKLLLSPSTAQIYYGDETARTLTPGGGVEGDATLRSFMNFEDLNNPNSLASLTLTHHQKIGKFRREHVSIGAGAHSLVQNSPYAFKREFDNGTISDKTLVYTGNDGDFTNAVNLFNLWPNGTVLLDYFSGNTATVNNNTADFDTAYGLLLIGEPVNTVITPPSSFTVNAKKPSDWGAIYAYVFNTKTNSRLAGTAPWPGQAMPLLNGSTVWNSLDINVPSGVSVDDVAIVFNNQNNGSQTIDLFRNRDGWFDFTSGGAVRNGVWTDDCPSDCPGASSSSFRVYGQKPADWNNIYAYVFSTAQNSVLQGTLNWPGQEMTKLAQTNAWYFYDIDLPSGISPNEIGLVFNNENNGSQSIDLTRDHEGWFNFTSGGAVRSGNWNETCQFDCPNTALQAILPQNEAILETKNSIVVFPNPIDGNGSMGINMIKSELVTVTIYNLQGRVIDTIYKGLMSPGYTKIDYELRQSGTYVYTILMGTEKLSGKLIVN